MTNSEKMVWTAAYASAFADSKQMDELSQAASAVAHAEYSLGALRLYEAEVGPGNQGYENVCEVLGVEEREEE